MVPAPVYAQGFVEAGGARKVLVVNKGAAAADVALAGATSFEYIDETTGYGPAVTAPVAGGAWTLAPFALGIARFA